VPWTQTAEGKAKETHLKRWFMAANMLVSYNAGLYFSLVAELRILRNHWFAITMAV
jgi:hypothetical protein